MGDQPIRKEAVAVAALAALGITYYMIDKNRKCSSFTKVWADPDPLAGLYLDGDVIEDAQHWMRQKLRSIILAQDTPNREILHEQLAIYISDCDWESSRKKRKGREVWDSLGKIVNMAFAEYNADPLGYMKG